MYFLFSKAGNFETSITRVPYNKLLTNLACSGRTGEYWPSVVFVRTSLRSVRTATTSGQYSPVRPSRSVSKRLLFSYKCVSHMTNYVNFKLSRDVEKNPGPTQYNTDREVIIRPFMQNHSSTMQLTSPISSENLALLFAI